jgi:hypothetical protein
MKSGPDSQNEMENPAPLPEQPSSESSNLSTKKEDRNFSAPLDLKVGDVKTIKSDLVNSLASYVGSNVTKEQKKLIKNFIDFSSKGFVASMSMTCRGQNCPFLSACVLNQAGAELPIGKPCPLEQSIIVSWVTKHLKALGIEDIDDPIHSFDMDMLYELAGQELLRWRCGVHLSDDPRLVSNQQVGATLQGEPIFSDVMNPVLTVMERAGKNITKIREALVATRESQLKAGQINTDPTQKAAELRAKAHEIAQARKNQLEKLVDADFKIKE